MEWKRTCMTSSCVQFTLILILLCANGAYGFPNGSGYTACKGTMEPKKVDGTGHGAGIMPQSNTPSPFQLHVDKLTVKQGEQVGMIISAKSDSDPNFKGFLLVVRKKGDDKTFYGEWKDSGDNTTRPVECHKDPAGGVTGVAATHASPSLKTSTKVYWVAPKEDGKFEIFFTVVTNLTTYWNQIQTPGFDVIEVKGVADSSQTQATMKSSMKACQILKTC